MTFYLFVRNLYLQKINVHGKNLLRKQPKLVTGGRIRHQLGLDGLLGPKVVHGVSGEGRGGGGRRMRGARVQGVQGGGLGDDQLVAGVSLARLLLLHNWTGASAEQGTTRGREPLGLRRFQTFSFQLSQQGRCWKHNAAVSTTR